MRRFQTDRKRLRLLYVSEFFLHIHHLFHVRELLAYRLATIHNIFLCRICRKDQGSNCSRIVPELKRQWL